MTDRAALWLRVSSTEQTAEIQLPALTSWCTSNGARVTGKLEARTSASKSTRRHEELLAEALDGVRDGRWNVIVCVALDRVERRGIGYLASWIGDIRKAGGRLVSTAAGEEWVGEVLTPDTEAMWWIRLTMEADRARRESSLKSERNQRAKATMIANGAVSVRLPMGWKIASGAKYAAGFAPDYAEQAAVRAAIEHIAEGGSYGTASKLTAELGCKRSAARLAVILRNDVYVTGKLDIGGVIADVDPVVDSATWLKMRGALAVRKGQSKRGGLNASMNEHEDTAGYSGRIFHDCPAQGALYRVPNTCRGVRHVYYRSQCCKSSIAADLVESAVDGLLSTMQVPSQSAATVDVSAAVADAEARKTAAFNRGEYDKLASFDAEIARLKATATVVHGETELMLAPADLASRRRLLRRSAEQRAFKVVVKWDKGRGNRRTEARYGAELGWFTEQHDDEQ